MRGPPSASADRAPLRDPSQRFVRRTLLVLLLVAATATGTAGVLHALEPDGATINRVFPPAMSLAFLALAVRHARRPERIGSTIALGWLAVVIGVGVPVWAFAIEAWRDGAPLVDRVPPVSSVLLPLLLVLVLFARPRYTVAGCVLAWLAIGAPVLLHLATHPAELWTPRGMDLAMAYGPVCLVIPLLIPLLRGAEAQVDALRREGERLQALAERDALVGLYNRRAGERFLATLLANARGAGALVLFDVDHFKSINDRHGHPAGDAVLVEIGARCAARLGPDDVFARWGGEEFLVVLPGADAPRAAAVAEALRAAVAARPIAPVGTVTASFGVTALQPEDTVGQVLQRADEALYHAKAQGRDRVVAR